MPMYVYTLPCAKVKKTNNSVRYFIINSIFYVFLKPFFELFTFRTWDSIR